MAFQSSNGGNIGRVYHAQLLKIGNTPTHDISVCMIFILFNFLNPIKHPNMSKKKKKKKKNHPCLATKFLSNQPHKVNPLEYYHRIFLEDYKIKKQVWKKKLKSLKAHKWQLMVIIFALTYLYTICVISL